MNDTYLKSKKVLIVDDEESLRSMLITILEDENYKWANPKYCTKERHPL